MNDLVSDTIAGYTHDWPSHVDIVMPGGCLLGARSDVWTVKGATFPAGVQVRPEGYAPFVKIARFTIPTTDDQAAAFYAFAQAQVGKQYDKWAVAGLAAGRDWRSPDKWFCSELAAAAFEQAKIIPMLSSGIEFISPRDFLIICNIIGIAA
jgi:hypothetical protein